MSFGNLQIYLLGQMKKDFANFKKADSSRLSKANYLQTRLQMLEANLEKAEGYNREIVGAEKLEQDLKVSDLVEIFEQIQEIYTDYRIEILDAIDKLPRSDISGTQHVNTESDAKDQRHSELRLPKIHIPVFGGGYETRRSFHDIFVSLIHNSSTLSEVQKLHYLKSSVNGEAERLLQHLAIDKGNYVKAWEILKDRYDHKRVLVNTQLKLFFGQSTLNSESAAGIKQVLDTSQEIIHSLKNLELPVESWDAILIFVMLQKLPSTTQQQWEEKLGSSKDLPNIASFFDFLQARFRALEAVAQQRDTETKHKSTAKNVFHTRGEERRVTSCKVCNKGQHSLRVCKKFLQMDVAQRKQAVFNVRVCENCLAYSHFKRECPSPKSCHYCKQRHNTLLHPSSHTTYHMQPELTSPRNVPPHPQQNRIQQSHSHTNTYQVSTISANAAEFQPQSTGHQTNTTQVSNFHTNTRNQVLLATALISVRTTYGGYLTLRALVDSGSEASFITEAAVQRLSLRTRRTFVKVNGLGSVVSGTSSKIVDLSIRSLNTTFQGEMQALVLKTLTGLLPAQRIGFDKWSYLGGLQLADPTFHIPARIYLLLGNDVYSEIVLNEIVRSNECLGPIAQRTQLGWILMGKLHAGNQNTVRSFVSQLDINNTLRKFWEIEEGPLEKIETDEDRLCEEHFLTNTIRLPDGRYQVRLPFKGGELPSMGDTYHGAVKRFSQLEKRLHSNPAQHKEYSKCMAEYIELGHMTPIESSDELLSSPFHYFIPHHAVMKESSTTTKLRVVFDATFKTSFGSSLNDMLMVGPKVQTNVTDIILRWRRYKHTFTGDVEKMYRQVRVAVPDANYQLIVWREDSSQELRIYRLNTITFGTAPAPFLAIRVLIKLADDETINFSRSETIIKEETYVDDIISGGDTIKEAQLKLKEVKDLLATAGFHLRKHVSNTEEVLQHIPLEQRDENFKIPCGEDVGVKTLGIKWNPISDVFSFEVAENWEGDVTKRTILSAVAKLYDPMGWISPCIVKAKIIMQQLWGRGIDWDSPVPTELQIEWLKFRRDLPTIKKIRIPRWINTLSISRFVEVHGFSDASESAYAAAVYLRVQDQDKQVHMHLLMSKTKVAPLTTITLPRLELCGATLLAKLLRETIQVLKLDTSKIYAWTDSVITLCWIRATPSRWKTFVGNRVSRIQQLASQAVWKHIPSEMNPADVASRGTLPSAIINNTLWWQGPEFLRHQWNAPFPEQPSCLETEREARPIRVHVGIECEESFIDTLINNFSSLSRLMRVVAYCLRLQRHKTLVPREEYLSLLEIEQARTKIVALVQQQMFPKEEREHIKGYTTLNPFTDEDGILRVGGRLGNAALSYNRKHPMLLRSNYKFTQLLIQEAHEKTLHGGSQKTVAYIRQHYWVLNLKKAVKKKLHDCVICFRFRAKHPTQLMGNLPAVRTTVSRPFQHSGVDYAGPVEIKSWRGRNAKTLKGYLAIFVCMATKAIHIEVVSDMTTQAFLGAFRRFVARRGLCRELYSDCGRNFIGGDGELRKLLREAQFSWKSVAEKLANEGTAWSFIPPASPHFGGLWEAGVKSVKFHLKRVAGNQMLTFEELYTLLTQVEACLNSRPLCPQTDDINDIQPLTPAHFLVGEPLLLPPEPQHQLEKISHLDRWKRVQTLMQTFWKRWSSEYLFRLQQRPKWMKATKREIMEGDLVLIKEE